MKRRLDRATYIYYGLLTGMFSALSIGLSVFLFTYCVRVKVGGNSAGCVYPHELGATIFLFLGLFLLIIACALFPGRYGQTFPTAPADRTVEPQFAPAGSVPPEGIDRAAAPPSVESERA
ncbi:MAG: hypothetical protein WA761_04100 [Thermoplasmata archaeon]